MTVLVARRHVVLHRSNEMGIRDMGRHCDNVGLMLVHRLRRWNNIKPTLACRHVLTEDVRGNLSSVK